ncbi:hypothetical protein M011DRAFT_268068 [Sporormia fimetaria CBS 119925]|uniref:RBR-type E3 ubiquitin transferase n=1 Tax=Sporormia fimetaria CBS 119925 TaxID=1340428 RepID=A0A6A6UW53_9PLEO|nr:hypothetical protein M011DRAFT_268068 [Sporormia fimetaria CBS 119925]
MSTREMDTLDDDIAALTLQIEELHEHESKKKGKHRADQVPDTETASSKQLSELEARLSYLKDLRLAHSIANAVDTDEEVIAALIESERQAEEDRAYAILISSENPELEDPPSPLRSTDRTRQEPMDAELARQMDELCVNGDAPSEEGEVQAVPSVPYAQRQARAIGNLSLERFQCCACTERFRWDSITTLECGDRYCAPCLTRVILRAVHDRNLACLPPRCHGTLIPKEVIVKTLTADDLVEFQNTEVEKETSDKTYCSGPDCGRFIDPRYILGDEATCPRCQTKTCHICKNASHLLDCPQDTELQATLDLGNALQWKRCYSCRALVERDVGCNHMTCLCGAEFCYVCRAPWVPRQCTCDLWEEENLIRRAEVLVDRVAPVALPVFERDRLRVHFQDELRENEHCEHSGRRKFERVEWGRPRRGFQCEMCEARHWKYILRCRRCRMDLCEDCRRNRV